ncbi:60s ribosome biogenesis protein mak11 [Dimargaris cristalligena]|nr:60s ribosome biogenesis protein mak11 [Dimargaris cristalligena]
MPPSKKVKLSKGSAAPTPEPVAIKESIDEPSPSTSPDSEPMTSFIATVGSYERLLYGLKAEWAETTTESPTDRPALKVSLIFGFPAHGNSITAVASTRTHLVTGSVDENINLFNTKRLKEIGSLLQHNGTITALRFFSKTHMISASEDQTIRVWRTKDWECLTVFKGHKDRVNDVAVHPTGRLAMSVSKDRTLRLWNLLTGRKASVNKIYKEGLAVQWDTSGKRYVVLSEREITIYNVADASVLHNIPLTKRIHCIYPLVDPNDPDTEYLLCGGDDKRIHIYDMSTGKLRASPICHEARVRALQVISLEHPTADKKSPTPIVTSISTDGKVKFWDFNDLLADDQATGETTSTSEPPTPLANYTTGCRLTCLTLS